MKISTLNFRTMSFVWLLMTTIKIGAIAQQDTLVNARVNGIESFSGTVTYDGSGAGTGGTEGTYVGYQAGALTTAVRNTFLGANSGPSNTSGYLNSFVGAYSGFSNTTGSSNTFVGYHGGYTNTTGSNNTFIGNLSGKWNTTGGFNVFLGLQAGYSNTTGGSNVFIGGNAGFTNATGQANVFVGGGSGFDNVSGISNVFIGNNAGAHELGSNKLYIANSNTATPLIFGDFSSGQLVFNGKVGVGTSSFPTSVGGVDVSAYKLFVKGGILADEVRVRTGWADYVFQNSYHLKPLDEVADYIKQNGYLPNMPSAEKVDNEGLSLGEISRIQQEKIEELTLYLIEQNNAAKKQQKEIEDLKELVKQLVVKK